ncbi:MAG: hypothetical protein GWP19_00560 [Planctomycetia bacterium]|nr:hypothetical protein [Planctomycetia bacterium]
MVENLNIEKQRDMIFLWNSLKNIPKLITYKQDMKSYMEYAYWSHFNKCKANNIEYFKCHKLCYGMVERKVALTRNLKMFPYYKRGTKGLLLEKDAVNLFSSKVQEEVKKLSLTNEIRLILFPDMVFTLPLSYYRYMK